MNVQSLQFIMFLSPGLRGYKSGLRGTVSVVNADTVTRAAARTSGSRCYHSGRSDGHRRDRGRGSHIKIRDTPTAPGAGHSLALTSGGDNCASQVRDTPTGAEFDAIVAGGLHFVACTSNGSLVSGGRGGTDKCATLQCGGW